MRTVTALTLALLVAAAHAAAQHGTDEKRKPNRLIGEKSPYLRQHAYNPVAWWPWGKAAFDEARKRGVPVFLSVGYSTCHWCHVMERESFENEDCAALMNASFVCIKLDREERPDVDAAYMKAVQMFTGGGGGWPASIWMTPDKKAFYAGTYYPPDAFKMMLRRISELWKSRRGALLKDADEVLARLRSAEQSKPGKELPDPALLERGAGALLSRHDAVLGGFGPAPKFPRTTVHELLFLATHRTGEKKWASAALQSLTAMASGGIHDQVGGGFHRYSTDAEWLVPHFEKMLYDQALIASTYLDAGLVSGDEAFFAVADDVLRCVLRDFRHESGGFFSAYDADSGGVEGSYYVWSKKELVDLLDGQAERLALERFHLSEDGNWHEAPGDNILAVRQGWAEVAAAIEVDPARARALWEEMRLTLLQVRNRRDRPGLDDKILTAWNGLMVSTLARAARIRGRTDYRDAAVACARFLLKALRTENGRLLRRWCAGEAAHDAVLRDHAALARGLVDLFETTGDVSWLDEARRIADAMLARFAAEGGGFHDAPNDATDLVLKTRDAYDGAIPSGNSLAACVLIRLADLTGDDAYAEAADDTLRAFRSQLARTPSAYPMMLQALAIRGALREIVIVGDPGKPSTRALRAVVDRTYLPRSVLCLMSDEQARRAEKTVPLVRERRSRAGEGVAYVCRAGTCLAPVQSPEKLAELLRQP